MEHLSLSVYYSTFNLHPVSMTKQLRDLTVVSNTALNERLILLRLTDHTPLPRCTAGQFVQVRIDGSPSTFLRRPISIHFVDETNNELWLLVQLVGDGTRRLGQLKTGDRLNVLLPLGNGFSPVQNPGERVLLVGGGVGIAPLLEYGKYLKENGATPIFLLGARTRDDLVQMEWFKQFGQLHLTTEDGTTGVQGFVTNHPVLSEPEFDRIAVCGPKPMMLAVARFAHQHNFPCEVSLENMMACGLGACLCCVEKTVRGNVCVCTEGPIFNINQLTWQI